MERETRIRQPENNGGQQPQASEFRSRRNPLVAGINNNPAPNELTPNTVDPFLSASTVVPSTVVTPTGPPNGTSPIGSTQSSVPPSSLVTDFHARQESADSGLGMGGSYSLPHTPEDFLTSMDDTMDTTLDCKRILVS